MKAIKNHKVTFSDISKYPEVRRDLSLLIDKGVTFDAIKKVVQKADKRLIKSVSLFDVYEGDKIADGKKSYAISIIIQDEEKTLNDKQIDRLMEQIMKSLDTEIGAKIR
jgi:phenylalanyl-tRNA synthetase beta chain